MYNVISWRSCHGARVKEGSKFLKLKVNICTNMHKFIGGLCIAELNYQGLQ
jgi:hypothetical protein